MVVSDVRLFKPIGADAFAMPGLVGRRLGLLADSVGVGIDFAAEGTQRALGYVGSGPGRYLDSLRGIFGDPRIGPLKLPLPHDGLKGLDDLVGSFLLGSLLVFESSLINWDIRGTENMISALLRARQANRGVMLVWNHRSWLDDPLALLAVFGMRVFTIRSKFWYSIADERNFRPAGYNPLAAFVRYFGEKSRLIYISRGKNRGAEPPPVQENPYDYLRAQMESDTFAQMSRVIMRSGRDPVNFLAGLNTMETPEDGIHGRHAALNQGAVHEAIGRLMAGQVVSAFPEGTRVVDNNPDDELGEFMAGVAKIAHLSGCVVLPMFHLGMGRVFPDKTFWPRNLGERVYMEIGTPIPDGELKNLRAAPPTFGTFDGINEVMRRHLEELRRSAIKRRELSQFGDVVPQSAWSDSAARFVNVWRAMGGEVG